MKKYILLVAMLVLSQSLFAQVSRIKGFSVGLDYQGGSWNYVESEDDPEAGNGGGLYVNYGFNDNIALNVRFDATTIKPEGGGKYTMGHFDLGVTYFFSNADAKLRPFAGIMYSGFSLVQEDPKVELAGAGFGGQAGINYFFTPNLAFHTALALNFTTLNSAKENGVSRDINPDFKEIISSRFMLGLKYVF
jgi:outer membrane protein W